MSLTQSLIHASGTAIFGYGLYYDLKFVHLPPGLRSNPKFSALTAFPGKWKFLTLWDVVIQLAYHSLALLNDVAGSSTTVAKKQTTLQKIRDGMFASLAFPVGTFVTVSFWCLYAVNPEFIFPPAIQNIFPSWLNHVLHTAPGLYVAIESYAFPRSYPARSKGSSAIIVGTGIYVAWINYVYQASGVWAYPILDVLNNGQRAAFMGASALTILGFYFFGETLNKYFWGSSSEKNIGGKKGKSKKRN